MREVFSLSPIARTCLRAAALGMVGGLMGMVPLATLAQDPVDWSTVPFVPFSTMQAVDSDGNTTWSVPNTGPPLNLPAYRLHGVVINDPAKMLNSAPSGTGLGGSWQVYIQSLDDPNDFGGCALWMGQNYSIIRGSWPMYNYTTEQWEGEMQRLNYPVLDPTGQGVGSHVTEPLRVGDVVEIHARAGMFNKGKYNCNEEHYPDPAKDFDIIILQRDVAVEPTDISLDLVKDAYDNFKFDQTRETGAEFYQSKYVTLRGVTISSTGKNWSRYGQVTVTDGTRTFNVKLGYNDAFNTAAEPTGTLDITGVFDQEDATSPFTGDYRMWACSPADFAPASSLIPGDANGDGNVDETDALRLAAHWGASDDASWFDGDFNRDLRINAADAAILTANWGTHAAEQTPVPEPCVFVLLLAALAAIARVRKR